MMEHLLTILGKIYKDNEQSISILRLYRQFKDLPEISKHYASNEKKIKAAYDKLPMETVKKVVDLRDLYFAHYDKRYFGDTDKLFAEFPLPSNTEIAELLKKTNELICAFDQVDKGFGGANINTVGDAKFVIDDLQAYAKRRKACCFAKMI